MPSSYKEQVEVNEMFPDNYLSQSQSTAMSTSVKLYLDLMKQCLTNSIYGKYEGPSYDAQRRVEGIDYPPTAHTMIGIKRLENIQFCVEDVLAKGIPGDLIETGVWRGGATIFMRAILKAYGINDRTVWVADSFKGLPVPNLDKYPHDEIFANPQNRPPCLQVSLSEVQANFAAYGLLDAQVRFLEGWFCDTLPTAPIEQLAVLRLDGDLYESTMDVLRSLYSKVSVGGYVIVDDYGELRTCRQAIDDFRAAEHVTETLRLVDHSGVYWQRSK